MRETRGRSDRIYIVLMLLILFLMCLIEAPLLMRPEIWGATNCPKNIFALK